MKPVFQIPRQLSLLLLAALLPGTGLAQSALTPEQLTNQVNRLTAAANSSRANVSDIKTEITALSADMDRFGRLIDNRAILEMLQRVDVLAEEISMLNGLIEEQGYALDEMAKRQRELYLDVDRRLRDIESSAAVGAVPSSNTSSAPTSENTSAQTDASGSTGAGDIQLPQPGVDATVAVESAAPANTPTQIPSVTQSEEKAAYQAAFDTLKEGRYKQAKTELMAFLENFPDSSFAGNAQYWLGEAHYVTRNFAQGIIEFEKVLANYSNSNKVPDAMLKMGYTYYELKQFDKSRQILNDLRAGHAKTTAARLATKRLDRMRKEGY
ncbi:MAG: tol-pal system protein YbgF [Planctomycetota bacterium]|jgi:tol-pal system protein YbgF